MLCFPVKVHVLCFPVKAHVLCFPAKAHQCPLLSCYKAYVLRFPTNIFKALIHSVLIMRESKTCSLILYS